MAVHKPDLPLSGEHSLPSGYVTSSRCRSCGIVIGFGERCDVCLDPSRASADQPGEYRGRHHTEWGATVDELIIQGDEHEAEYLLLRLVEATEAEALVAGVPPFERHFQRLEQIARRRGDRRLEENVRARFADCARRVAKRHDGAAG